MIRLFSKGSGTQNWIYPESAEKSSNKYSLQKKSFSMCLKLIFPCHLKTKDTTCKTETQVLFQVSDPSLDWTSGLNGHTLDKSTKMRANNKYVDMYLDKN